MKLSPPEHIEIEDDLILRWVTAADAEAMARSVAESLDHLKPWMPWADARSADTAFQQGRLRDQAQQRKRGEEWQYALFRSGDGSLLGAFGLMTRRGPGSLEIGYWLHVDAGNRGYATRSARALTEAGLQLDGIDRMIIVCDEANTRSAAIPKRLGYTLDRVETRVPEAPGETGRMQLWIADRIEPATTP
ncbi:MAG TPA: GNAT family N-acetyltransferase [Acidimicrobiia bacterium]|jgi:RimJ/RimL family protein N-acetyltransferase|nr:GNAT family N-acetyltransferase [Acidimicrobiia bacterium]